MSVLVGLSEMYKTNLGRSIEVKAKVESWRIVLDKMCTSANTKIRKVSDLMQQFNPDFYTNVYNLLKIFCFSKRI